MNEIYWILFLLVDLTVTVLIFKYLGKEGLFLLIGVNIILCNIQVLKLVELFGITITLGNILYGSIYFSTDLLSEFYGKKEAVKGVLFGFLALLLMTIYMKFSLLFIPAENDFINDSLKNIFSFMPRIALASLSAYILSQIHDVYVYSFYKHKTKGRFLWLRNNLSTMVSQLIDSVVFVFIAFWGVFEINVFWSILITTYIMKFIVAVLDTPFIYLASKLKKNEV